MKTSILGLGYIGLPTAAILASKNIEVVGVDVNREIVDTINSLKYDLVEPGLNDLVRSVVRSGYLRATVTLEKSDVFVVCVPTPLTIDRKPDISFVQSAIRDISPLLEKGNLIVLESTSPVGTTQAVSKWIKDERSDLTVSEYETPGSAQDVHLAYCPERVMPGNVIRELVENDRIIGGLSSYASNLAVQFYRRFVVGECLVADVRSAELCKLVENSYRDVNIAFANELSLISDKLGVNVWNLIELVNRHPRVNVLQPGPGVGGHCIAVDPWFIVNSAPDEAHLIRIARSVNHERPKFVIKQLKEIVEKTNKEYSELTISCLGLSYKADVNDLRESPALWIAEEVSRIGFYKQYVVEPYVDKLPALLEKNKTVFLEEIDEALKNSDIILLLTDHRIFKEIDLKLLENKRLLDFRGIWVR